jgi:6-phosphogluconolactonase
MEKIVGGRLPAPTINILPTIEDFEIAAAHAIEKLMTAAIRECGRCMVSLSGGTTPRGIYRHLGDLLAVQSVDLTRVHFIFGDERMVAPDDPESNYGMALHELISRIAIPLSNVHRIKGEINPEAAALEYEEELKKVFPLFAGRCDVMLLGVGEDGHTASLFPRSELLHERLRMVRSEFVPGLEKWRVTLTLPVINRSRAVMFLESGEQKAAIVGKILAATQPNEEFPASFVHPDPGSLTWMLDSKAASRLSSEFNTRVS